MKITVIGTGYVGLVSGTCLAEKGNQVLCIDSDIGKINQLKSAASPIYEKDLDGLLQRNIENNNLQFSTSLLAGVLHGELIFLALPTPEDKDGQADLSILLTVVNDIAPHLQDGQILINKSTVPVGTADKVKSILAKAGKTKVAVASNPEFLREGFAVADFMQPDRVIIGADDSKVAEKLAALYCPFVADKTQIIGMDTRSAEITKYAANAFLVTKISFINEMANFCEKVGANVDNVRLGIGSDRRIGADFLYAGMGYGGSCFPKDIHAILKSGNAVGHEFRIIEAAMAANQQQKTVLLSKIAQRFTTLTGIRLAVWGLAFKAGTDDVRESPALELIKQLIDKGASVCAYDPKAMLNVKKQAIQGLDLGKDKFSICQNADALIVCTEWDEFKTADLSALKNNLKIPIIFDGRNLYSPQILNSQGFEYYSIGRTNI